MSRTISSTVHPIQRCMAASNPSAWWDGLVIDAVIRFVSIAAVVFFLIVKPMSAMAARRARGEEPVEDTPAPSDEALLLTEIRDLLQTRQ